MFSVKLRPFRVDIKYRRRIIKNKELFILIKMRGVNENFRLTRR